MFNKEEFKQHSLELINWISEYLNHVEKYPVRSKVKYGEIRDKLDKVPPAKGQSFKSIFSDFENYLLPGITHWQSPKYFAYFPANNSEPSILAEFLTAALGVQGMKWITSPTATELEEQMMVWLRIMLDLPESFTGVIQDTASVATLCALLAAREKATSNRSNAQGIFGEKLRVYCSSEAHSSIEKAVRIAGLGSNNLIKIDTDEECRMIPQKLQEAIKADLAHGYKPCCAIAALGTTGTCAIDPIDEIGTITRQFNIWLHIDAAFAGTALVLPEFRATVPGIEKADSFVFNPHKWMFTNFDCSAFFVKDREQLQDTFRLVPAYLQTEADAGVNDYSNWGIQLGRRFRSLKLWFVIRNFGVEGIQERIREHISLSEYFENRVIDHPYLELVVPRNLSVICFRYNPGDFENDKLDKINTQLLERINASGELYMSHTRIAGKFCLRFVCAQTNTQKQHVVEAIKCIDDHINKIRTE